MCGILYRAFQLFTAGTDPHFLCMELIHCFKSTWKKMAALCLENLKSFKSIEWFSTDFTHEEMGIYMGI